jgi:hypothetical protein
MNRVLALCLCLCATPALGQTVYVGAAAGSDTTLASQVETSLFPNPDAGGTVPAFAGRIGVALADQWGIELEVSHSLALETRFEESRSSLSRSVISSGVITNIGQIGSISLPQSTLDSEQRTTSLNAVGWFRHPLSSRVELAFLGGAAFYRTVNEQRMSFDFLPQIPGFPQLFPPIVRDQSSRFVAYGVGPLVGAEAWIAFGDHVRVVPGVRLSSFSSQWSVRPSAAFTWVF